MNKFRVGYERRSKDTRSVYHLDEEMTACRQGFNFAGAWSSKQDLDLATRETINCIRRMQVLIQKGYTRRLFIEEVV